MFSKKIGDLKSRLLESIRLIFMFPEDRRYYLWKKAALKAREEGLTTTCVTCDGPIFPGQFVAEGLLDGKKVMAHAGFHYTLEDSDPVICETGGIGIGYWNGKEIDGTGESAASKVMRTGVTVAFNHK